MSAPSIEGADTSDAFAKPDMRLIDRDAEVPIQAGSRRLRVVPRNACNRALRVPVGKMGACLLNRLSLARVLCGDRRQHFLMDGQGLRLVRPVRFGGKGGCGFRDQLQRSTFHCSADVISQETDMHGTLADIASINLTARERMRRRALWAMGNRELRAQALADLDRIERLDGELPIGEAADWTLEELATRVPISRRDDPLLEVVTPADIPEPWRSRMAAASIGVTMASAFPGYYITDWREFLKLWCIEHEQLRAYRLEG